ncbi:MAG TPA: DHHA1 domain-containing protein [archaeon]|nr:DHHA1 domain-containing protein [archaeon]
MKKLKRNLDDIFEKGILFIKNTKKDEKTFLVYHKDVDGLCSAAVLLRAFENFNLKPTKILAASNEEMEGIIKKMKDFDKAIVLDIDISYLKKELEEVGKEILLIDHHPPRADLNGEKILYINPRLENPKFYQPVSYLVFKIFSKSMDLEDLEWVSVLGTVGDMGYEDCKDLLKTWVEVETKEDLVKTAFWKDVGMLNGLTTTIGFEKTLELVQSFGSLTDFRESDELKKSYKKFEIEYGKFEKTFWKNAKKIEEINLVISEVESDDRALSSFLSTNLATEHPKKIIVLMRRANDTISINARYRGENMNIGKIMEMAAKGLNGGGGHQSAAGATIKAKNGEIFKERLIKELMELSDKRK